ncbi:hypothetical protein ACHWQZ_G005630 [Mnemiopsis leidyi]
MMWNELQGKFDEFSSVLPMSRFDSRNKPLNLPWSNSNLKRMRRNKDAAWKSFVECPCKENYSFAFVKDKMYADEEFRLKSNYEKKLTNNLKTNCKGFYSYLRNKRQLKTGIPTLEKSDGSRTSSPAESAEALAEAFSSVFVREPENLPRVEKPVVESEADVLGDIEITFDKVKHELESLNCFKSFGPDGIHPKLLKSLAGDSSFVNAVVKCTDKIKEAAKSLQIPVRVVTTPGKKLRDILTSSRPLDKKKCPSKNCRTCLALNNNNGNRTVRTVVYEVKCSYVECQQSGIGIYNGETYRPVGDRYTEQFRSNNPTAKSYKDMPFAKHYPIHHQEGNPKLELTFLQRASTTVDRKVKEAQFILKNKPDLNKRDEQIELRKHAFYTPVLSNGNILSFRFMSIQ